MGLGRIRENRIHKSLAEPWRPGTGRSRCDPEHYVSHFPDDNAADIRFVADTHFKSRRIQGEPERRERFMAFLDSLPAGCHLYMIGDIFDFYFEYRSVVPKRFADLFAAIAESRRRGVRVSFVGGNHDYWVGDFFKVDLGVEVHDEQVAFSAQGRRVVCVHGDLAMPGDWGYKVLKAVIRNRAVIAVSRWLHPDVMDAIATLVATGSRKLKHSSQGERARQLADHAHNRCFAGGNDIYVMGHVHHALHDVRGKRDFMIVGDWMDGWSYGRLFEGRLTLEHGPRGG